MDSPTVLITGCNRGLGLELANQYLQADWSVVATCRHPESAARLRELEGRGNLQVYELDVTSPESVEALARGLEGRALDLLIHNAGAMGPRDAQSLGSIDYRAWQSVLATNVLGPSRLTEALLGNLKAGSRRQIAVISSRMGSTALNEGGYYIYRSSKAAVNSLVAGWCADLAGLGFVVLALHPGWVKTEMGGPSAPLSAEESVSGLCKVIEANRDPARSGSFLAYDGSPIPW